MVNGVGVVTLLYVSYVPALLIVDVDVDRDVNLSYLRLREWLGQAGACQGPLPVSSIMRRNPFSNVRYR